MIQIDMPMPKNCLDCPACNEYLMCAIPINGRKWGENDVREFGQGRPEWCPLKEQEAMNVDAFVQWCIDSHIMGDATVSGIKYWVGKYKEQL